MNWTQFLAGTAVLYLLYYGANVLHDLYRSGGATAEGGDQAELTFSEDTAPAVVAEAEAAADEAIDKVAAPQSVLSSGDLQFTGAVSLKQLFALAQSDLIQYTKAIPY